MKIAQSIVISNTDDFDRGRDQTAQLRLKAQIGKGLTVIQCLPVLKQKRNCRRKLNIMTRSRKEIENCSEKRDFPTQMILIDERF